MLNDVRVLVGVPDRFPSAAESQLEAVFLNCYQAGSTISCVFTRGGSNFLTEYMKNIYDLIVCVDDISGGDTSYAAVIGFNNGRVPVIVIVPNSCYGYTQLASIINNGFTNILFQKDMSVPLIRQLINSKRSKDDALLYCGVDFRPAPKTMAPDVIPDQPKKEVGPKIVKRYLGNNIGVARLVSRDAKFFYGSEMGEDDVMSEILSGDFDVELGDAQMPYKEFKLEDDWIKPCKEQLKSFFQKAGLMHFRKFENGDMPKEEFEQILYGELHRMSLSGENASIVIDSFLRDTLSYGRLDVLVNCPDVSDIRLMNMNTVNVQYRGVWYRTNVVFDSQQEYENFITKMCTMNHAAVNIREADLVFTDINTFPGARLRITVTHSLLSTASTYSAHIRINRLRKKTVQGLIAEGFWTREQAAFLTTAVKKGKSIIICGGSGSGKTILLNLLFEFFPVSICGECVQESDELHSETHPNIEFLHSINAKGEGGVEYTLKRLATKALLKNAEVFVIGEIKGDEAADFFTACRTSKVYTTTHAEDVFGALPRITELAKYSADYSQNDILKILAKNIDYVVYAEKYKIKQIASVVGWDDEREDVLYDLYDFNAKREDYEKI